MWTAQAYPLNRPRQWLTSGGLGTMGFGLPAAIGAALANPDRKVLCFSGDGSLMMNIQEMATASENQLDVKIILMNKRSAGAGASATESVLRARRFCRHLSGQNQLYADCRRIRASKPVI
ncbi:acetolactate synthase isozyme I large subunit [Escherichia coli]|uniref:Acetolactate synthase isozyme I large subunit n=1 Tax=Escherichia coli TaxID=562 RepID=A0A377AIG3_ECOLX|nr:acetolactate synthase isozyme I large subunit [Escherichia coli]